MKKILLVTRPICPPWDEASKNFAFYLAQNVPGFEFYLLTNGVLPGLEENIKQKPIYTSSGFGYFQKLKLITNLRKMKNDFDIIHYLFTPTKQNSFLIKNLVSKSKAKTIQTVATLREDLYSEKDWKNIIFSDAVITYSDYAKQKLESYESNNSLPGSELHSATRVKRVYPGIDLNLYSPAPKNLALMDKLEINSQDFVITFPGEYTRLGITDELVKYLIQKADYLKNNNFKVIFAFRVKNNKDAEKKDEIRIKLETAGLSKNILLPDTFTTMEKVYNISDIIIYPIKDMKGKFDIPLAIIEAMACARPVVLSDLPIFQEFANTENSVKIEVGNLDQLFQSIDDLRKNPEKSSRIGAKAREFVADNFDIKKVGEKYKEIYEQL